MKRSRQCILPEIIKPQKGRKSSASHASHQCTFLRIKTIRPYTLMSEQMQCLILICIICFLKNSYIIYAAFMKILILSENCFSESRRFSSVEKITEQSEESVCRKAINSRTAIYAKSA